MAQKGMAKDTASANTEKSYDLLVIGTGPGGYVAAIRAAQLGMKVAVVEKESLGGVCLNWGCIPTKALLKSAEVYGYLRHAQDYGCETGQVSVNFEKMIQRSRSVAGGMNKGVQFLLKKHKIAVHEGCGKLLGKGLVELATGKGKKDRLQAKHVILATGARVRTLPQVPMDGKTIIGYREAMTLSKRPSSMVIVGSGAIGMEFAYFYHTLGTRVTLVEALDRVLPAEDKEVSEYMEKHYTKAGMEVMTAAKLLRAEKTKQGLAITLATSKGEKKVQGEVLLLSVGIVANIEGLGLEDLSLRVADGKVLVDDYYRTNVEGVYAIGDMVKGPALAHVASAEGIVCVEQIAGLSPAPIDYHNVPSCVYCKPEIASVGYTEEAARAAGYELKVGRFPFTASGKAQAAGTAAGFVKVIYDARYGECLGAHMVGAQVTEMIAEVVAARKLETTAHEIIKAIHPHPTLSEAMMEATAEAYGEAIHL